MGPRMDNRGERELRPAQQSLFEPWPGSVVVEERGGGVRGGWKRMYIIRDRGFGWENLE
jgi:hypothetical protein